MAKRSTGNGRGKQRIEVPVGLEKLLYLAARDPELERRLLADRPGIVRELGLELRRSELEVLERVPDATLRSMIRALVPENPRRRRMMKVVAAAAATLAASTAAVGCDSLGGQSKGCTVDDAVDGAFDAAADTDTDSDTVDTEVDTNQSGGIQPDDGVDGDFD